MFYTVYKITNLIDNKIYIGAHKTPNLDDGYMGSGKVLKRAQKKYGMKNFEKEILEVFESSEEMFEMESKLVNEDFVKDSNTYNLKIGGAGGFDYINSNNLSHINNNTGPAIIAMNKAVKVLRDSNSDYDIRVQKARIPTMLNKSILLYNDSKEIFRVFKGKKHSIETKRIIGIKNSIKQQGEGNSQFGTMWIHNLDLKESKKIKKDELPNYESLGWLKGRKIKWKYLSQLV